MKDGFRVNGMHLCDDFGQVISSRDTGSPTKKLATKTVPFMNGFYDFSKLYGAVAFEDREVKYTIGIIGQNRFEVQDQKMRIMDWLSSVHNADIYDDDIEDYHFRGSFSSASWSEDEHGESGTLEVTFLCHPFLIADYYTSVRLEVGTHTIMNINQAVYPIAVPEGAATVSIGQYTQAVSKEQQLNVPLVPGENAVQVSGNPVTLKWLEERA